MIVEVVFLKMTGVVVGSVDPTLDSALTKGTLTVVTVTAGNTCWTEVVKVAEVDRVASVEMADSSESDCEEAGVLFSPVVNALLSGSSDQLVVVESVLTSVVLPAVSADPNTVKAVCVFVAGAGVAAGRLGAFKVVERTHAKLAVVEGEADGDVTFAADVVTADFVLVVTVTGFGRLVVTRRISLL